MLSRVACNIYWMARYVERAENIARLIDVNYHLSLDAPEHPEVQWAPLIAIMADEKLFKERYDEMSEENVLKFLVSDADNPNSILSCLRMARENARSIREIIPSEMWLQINTLYLMVKDAAARGTEDATTEFFNRIKSGGHLFFGLMDDIMTRGEGYHFARLGRAIERADKASRIIDVKYFILLPKFTDVGTPFDVIQWMAVLKSVSAYEMYWKKHARIEPRKVMHYLILDENFPRSIRFCLNEAGEDLLTICDGIEIPDTVSPVVQLNRLREKCLAIGIDDIIGQGVHEYVDSLQRSLNDLHQVINNAFFEVTYTDASSDANRRLQ